MALYDEWKAQHDYDKLVIEKWREEHVLPIGTRVRANTDLWDEYWDAEEVNRTFTLVDINTKGTIVEVIGTYTFPEYIVDFDNGVHGLWVCYAHDGMDINEIDVVSKPKAVIAEQPKPEQMELFSS